MIPDVVTASTSTASATPDLFDDLEADWEDAGGSAGSAPMAAGIALAESSGDPDAANTSDPYGGSYGLWQINGSHAPGGLASPTWEAQIENPEANAAEAVSLSADGTNWQPWTDDRLWDQWQAAGAPNDPSAGTVQGWLADAGAPTGTGAPTAQTVSFFGSLGNIAKGIAEGAGGALGLIDGGDSTAAGGVAGAASAAGAAVAGPIEHFVAKALLILAGLGIAAFGVAKIVSPGHDPTTVIEDAGEDAAKAGAAA